MKITNCGRGIHAREVPGLEKLKALPEPWHAFTNLDLSLPGRGVREIDVVLVIEDRVLLVDLKDWVGPIESREGNWFNNGRDCGKSPVQKINDNARELMLLLKRFVANQEKVEQLPDKLFVPFVSGAVVLTQTANKNGIADNESSQVFPIDFFVRMLRSRSERMSVLGKVPMGGNDFSSEEWIGRFRRFFNVASGIFQPGVRRYGGFRAIAEVPSFSHSREIFSEFDVQEEGFETSFGLLRRWDFTKADTRFQTQAGREDIAGREKSVIAWLSDRNPECDARLLKPRIDDPERGVSYWEVYERRRKLRRMSEFLRADFKGMTKGERMALAPQLLASLKPIHDLKAAHLDLGVHSIWLERPTTAKLSHLMAASFPEVKTLGKDRYQFLSSSMAPEDVLGLATTAQQKDVFLAGCMVHALTFGVIPSGAPPEWKASIDSNNEYLELHSWFARALDLDPSQRFSDASEMLDAFNRALVGEDPAKALIQGLERFKTIPSQRQIFKTYPETELLREDDRIVIWRSDSKEGSRVVKLWKSEGIGDLQRERSRILAFLERSKGLSESPLPGTGRIVNVHWTGDCIALVEDFLEGETLEKSLSEGGAAFATGALAFTTKLIDTVELIHQRGIAHGDLKPENILVQFEETGIPKPCLIDLLDFCPSSDGERSTPAYSPPAGGRLERDRYAVTKIAEQILRFADLPDGAKSFVGKAIGTCRIGPPPNATLLPLREAIERVTAPPISNPRIDIAVRQALLGPIISDEGSYWVSRQGSTLSIRGATERLEVQLSAGEKTAAFSRRVRMTQADIRRRRRFEYASFAAEIEVSRNGFTSVDPLLQFLDRNDIAIQAPASMAADLGSADDDDSDEREETTVDELSEKLLDEKPVSHQVFDCHRLWQRLVEVEAALITEAVATGDSSFRRATRRHVVSIQIAVGEIDFDRNDTVVVEREDSKGRWQKVGVLDIAKSTTDFIAIESWFELDRAAVLVSDGNRLRFQSRYENTSMTRRAEATTRILHDAAAAPGLLSVFQPSANFIPLTTEVSVDDEELKARYELNEVQIQAFKRVLQHRPLSLLQGPPGTGKTRFIGALIHFALTHGLARNVLLASQAHEAVNNAGEMTLSLFGGDRDSLSLIRVGHEESISDQLRPWHVAKVERGYKERFHAALQERVLIVAKHLGIDESVANEVLRFETAIRPILAKLTDLMERGEEARANGLRTTLGQLMPPLEDAIRDANAEEVEAIVTNLHLSTFPKSQLAQIERLQHVIDLGKDIVGSVSTWQRSFETFLAGTRQVVAGTCVGLGRTSLGLTKTMFDLVVVDEAARCTSSELAVPIQAGKWIVLVGDHAQLEPQHRPEVVKAIAHELGLSLAEVSRSDFERVFESGYGTKTGSTLTKQYRMLPAIGRMVSSAFYGGRLEHGRPDPLINVDAMPEELRLPLTWVQTDKAGELGHQRPGRRRGSLTNALEVDAIISLIRRWSAHEPLVDWMAQDSHPQQLIGIICAYAAQRDLVWKRLQTENVPDVVRRAIKVDTIDSYQGKENRIVILSLVRNNEEGPLDHGVHLVKPGFLSRSNRVNVAVSRAMDRLVIVGCRTRWREGSPVDRIVREFEKEVVAGEAVVYEVDEILQRLGRRRKKGDGKSVDHDAVAQP